MIHLAYSSVFVDDQDRALAFYTEVLGLELAADTPLGPGARWLTVRSSQEPGAVELVLEPSSNPIASTYQRALREAQIPCTSLRSDDLARDVERIRAAGAAIVMEPTDAGTVTIARFEDGCGNLLQLQQLNA